MCASVFVCKPFFCQVPNHCKCVVTPSLSMAEPEVQTLGSRMADKEK